MKSSNGRFELKTSDKFIEDAIKIHGDLYDYTKTRYERSNIKVIISCPIHGDFEQFPSGHLQGRGCRMCGIQKANLKRSLSLGEFKKRCVKIHKNKYDYSEVCYIKLTDSIKIICPIHGEFFQIANDHLRGRGCPKCWVRAYDNISFIGEANKVHRNKYDYSKVVFKKGDPKLKIICPVHGEFLQKVSHHLNGSGCPYCRESKGEVKIKQILNELKIYYIQEKKFGECRDKGLLSFDFYLPEHNLCIEYDGEQHYEVTFFQKTIEKLKETQKRDSIKNNFCKENNINLLRIPYWDFDNIENILTNYIFKNKSQNNGN